MDKGRLARVRVRHDERRAADVVPHLAGHEAEGDALNQAGFSKIKNI